MQNKSIIVKNLSYSYINEETGEYIDVIKNLSFDVDNGEFVSLIGPSGCGKSTLLKIIANLIKAKSGKIIIDTSRIAFVFQNFALFPWLTVKENIEFGLKMNNTSKKERNRISKEKIKEVGLLGFENKYPKELSGGMKQRVGIARALAVSPNILLMDEPFSSLDALTADKLRIDLLNIWKKYKMTIVMVTHLVEEAVELSDRVLILSPRPTSIKESIKIKSTRPRDKRSDDYYKIVDNITKNIKQ